MKIPENLSPEGRSAASPPLSVTMASGSSSESNGQPVGDHNVELRDMAAKASSAPLEDDIMQLARLGEIGAIQKLFDSKKYDATYKDEQGITPLHVRFLHEFYYALADYKYSGPRSIITMPCATT